MVQSVVTRTKPVSFAIIDLFVVLVVVLDLGGHAENVRQQQPTQDVFPGKLLVDTGVRAEAVCDVAKPSKICIRNDVGLGRRCGPNSMRAQ